MGSKSPREEILLKKEVEKLKDEISIDLKRSAQSYYTIGIDAFHRSRLKSWVDFQPAIGNLAISVELLLKAIIAYKAIRMLFSDLSDEAQLLLSYPETLSKEHNSKSFLNDLKNFSYQAIKLDKSIALFYLFFPELKQEFKQFFSSLASVRNISVHASIPDFQKYELDRIAYFSTKLFIAVTEIKALKYYHFKPSANTESFLKSYQDEKIKKVKNALENAKEQVKKGKLGKEVYYSDDWESMDINCPICGDIANVHGETEEETDSDGIHLTFLCESFSCITCGLELEDYEELELAGMDTTLERNEDIEKWADDHGYYDYDDRW